MRYSFVKAQRTFYVDVIKCALRYYAGNFNGDGQFVSANCNPAIYNVIHRHSKVVYCQGLLTLMVLLRHTESDYV